MTTKFKMLLWLLPGVMLLQSCSRSSSNVVKAHHFDEPSGKWVIEMPETATEQQILSNYFAVLLLHDGKPVATDPRRLKGTAGEVLSETTNSVRQIHRYSTVQAVRAWCGGPDDYTDYYRLDTDQGRLLISVERASVHSDDPKTTGWRCGFEDPDSYGFLFNTNRAEP